MKTLSLIALLAASPVAAGGLASGSFDGAGRSYGSTGQSFDFDRDRISGSRSCSNPVVCPRPGSGWHYFSRNTIPDIARPGKGIPTDPTGPSSPPSKPPTPSTPSTPTTPGTPATPGTPTPPERPTPVVTPGVPPEPAPPAVPLPAALWLMLAGLAGLGVTRFRR